MSLFWLSSQNYLYLYIALHLFTRQSDFQKMKFYFKVRQFSTRTMYKYSICITFYPENKRFTEKSSLDEVENSHKLICLLFLRLLRIISHVCSDKFRFKLMMLLLLIVCGTLMWEKIYLSQIRSHFFTCSFKIRTFYAILTTLAHDFRNKSKYFWKIIKFTTLWDQLGTGEWCLMF